MDNSVSPPAEKPETVAYGKKGRSGLKLAVFVVIAATVFVIFKYTGLGYYFGREFVEGLLAKLGVWAPVSYILIYTVATMLAVPGTLLTILGGVVFGSYFGTFLVVIGATFGASGAFFIARFLARDFIQEKFGDTNWFHKLDDGIREEGIYFVLFIRLVPVFPFNGINFATGLTSINFRDYFFGTLVGIIPASFVFANAASEAVSAAEKGLSSGFLLSLVLLGFVAIVPIAYKRFRKPKKT